MEENQLSHSDYEVVPGTVYLVTQPSHNANQHGDIILVPTPSNDLGDPLRTVMTALGNWESSVYVDIQDALGTSINQLNVGTALTLLMLGVGNVFFTPLSHKFGRRIAYLSSLAVVIGCHIWLATARNSGDFIGAHVLFGLGRAPYEALVPISIADIFFAHERGFALGIYAFGLSAGSSVGPICSGYMIETLGWRWVYWWGAILCRTLFVAIFLTLEESNFVRDSELSQDPAQESVLEAIQHDKGEKQLHSALANGSVYRVGQVLETDSFHLQYRPWVVLPGTWGQFVRQVYRPLQLAWFPAIVWSGLEYGACVSWITVLGTTTASILGSSPYNMSNEVLGLIWLSPLIGGLFGALMAGPFNDKLVLFLTRRNRGWLEPEFRLWVFIPMAFLMSGGLILYGVGAANSLPWIGPVVGMGLVGFGLTVAAALTMAYAVDCYKEVDGEAITTVILIRNIIGCAMTFGIQPWIDSMVAQDTFILVCFLSFIITVFAGAFIIWGKKFRLLTKMAYLSFAGTSSREN
ncbi:HOL1 substrate-H+ antiporter [Fusarium pseudocircinatum]|uniref:HOL1 substrate-H+ antiporter n=1 Tax=Fusarium pseudocircinatum TaxID=56676 RepID=A0A8H5KV57_9HYPO|nr:HOL1 substrate-H+ antiporter [Fusarium pseudocircinatum]